MQMGNENYWAGYPATYRQAQVRQISNWLAVGESCELVGVAGSGKSNCLNFIAHRPAAVQTHAPHIQQNVQYISVDINGVSPLTSANFYRALLLALRRGLPGFSAAVQDEVNPLFNSLNDWNDAFWALATLQDIHRAFVKERGNTLVWLLDRFDEAVLRLDAHVLNSLRSLRDISRGQICFVVATRQPIADLRNQREIDEFYEIIAGKTCWIGPMVRDDVRWVTRQMGERLGYEYSDKAANRLFECTGGLPSLLRAGCTGLAEGRVRVEQPLQTWIDVLLQQTNVRRSCEEIWNDLASEERESLIHIAGGRNQDTPQPGLSRLAAYGLTHKNIQGKLCIISPLLSAYIRSQSLAGPGLYTIDHQRNMILRDGIPIDSALPALQVKLLIYLVENADRICTYEEIMSAVWSEEAAYGGISNDALAQHISRLRAKIKEDYNDLERIQTVRGRGYRFIQEPDTN